MDNPYFKEKCKPVEVRTPKTISQLLSEMARTGFQGRKLGEVVDVWEAMLKERDLTIIMGLAGSMSTTGQWKIVNWLIENRYIDVLVSTGANISEDILEAMGGSYWKGSSMVDDADLLEHQIDRFYDVYADEMEYRRMEGLLRLFMGELDKSYVYSSREFLYILGKYLERKSIWSIAATAARHNVPIFSPALVDSGYGVAAFLAGREDGVKITIGQAKDFEEFALIGENTKKTGVIYIGGGVPKDFIQLLTIILDLMRGGSQVYPHEYAIQITTDSPQWGGLSGCTFEEAVSWGKIAADAKKVVCHCDATIALPIVAHALAERVKFKRTAPDFSKLYKT